MPDDYKRKLLEDAIKSLLKKQSQIRSYFRSVKTSQILTAGEILLNASKQLSFEVIGSHKLESFVHNCCGTM